MGLTWPGDVRHSRLSVERNATGLGWTARVAIDQGLAALVATLADHPP
jgi:nucleoside-diphosphate-sugar epimerase